ncbi:MAG: hypothetical protein ABIY52_12965 [Gemmatimonadaceae bacterium]
MISNSVLMLLRLIHIVVGMFWVGGAVFIAWFLVPAIRGAGPAGGAVIGQLQERKMSMYIMFFAIFTILSGLGLYWNDSAGFGSAWRNSGPGRTFGLGAAFAIVTMILGMTVNSPTAKKLGELGASMKAAGGPPNAEQQAEMLRLQMRLGKAGFAAAVLLTCAAAAMSVARYVP